MDKTVKITIITATFNRAYTLKRLYKSIKNQTNKDFEWIVIDDGSQDETRNLLRKWKDDNFINMDYIKQENMGKHVALNRGIEMANGKMIFIVDSDDYIVKNAIEIIINKEKEISNKKDFAGIAFNKGYNENKIIGRTFKRGIYRCYVIRKK